jgi:hypothetical protein
MPGDGGAESVLVVRLPKGHVSLPLPSAHQSSRPEFIRGTLGRAGHQWGHRIRAGHPVTSLR